MLAYTSDTPVVAVAILVALTRKKQYVWLLVNPVDANRGNSHPPAASHGSPTLGP